jgi:hypothetical protein
VPGAIEHGSQVRPALKSAIKEKKGVRMARTLTILFRRDPARDRQQGRIVYTGYQFFWPDGRPIGVALEGFCRHGQRLLGLDRYLVGQDERLIELLCFPIQSMNDDITRLPGHRVRRFFLQRNGQQGRLHFMDGTATETVFELGRDEARVLDWIGLPSLEDGDRQWLDLTAHALQPVGVTG